MIKILYLEDENYLGRIVKESLKSRGFNIKLITDGKLLMKNFEHFQPDICVLDIMVPNIDGLTLGKEIKKSVPDMPIIYLTAKNQTLDVLKGFEAGANDYIKKPFSMEELIVRINNILALKKIGPNLIQEFTIGSYTFDYANFKLSSQTKEHKLSHKENELLLALAKHQNQKLDRRKILNELWGDDSVYHSRNLDVYIRKLRVYFEDDASIQIKTLRGIGYYFSVK